MALADSQDEHLSAEHVDRLKLVAVVDSARTFSNNDCVFLDQKNSRISHLAVNQETTLQFDELISSYD